MPLTVELTEMPESRPDSLAAFAFGDHRDGAINHVGLTPLGDTPACESWRTPQTVTAGRDGGLYWRKTQTLLVGSIVVPLDDDVVESTRALYRQVLACVHKLGYPHLLRIWNFMPRINAGDGDRERYKCFNLGRALALDERGGDYALLPAATAVGTRSGDHLLVYFLAAREAGHRLQNPRQVNAFEYPRDYGPRSPLFSRAAILSGEGPSLLLVSGTASIVGHESRHPGDLQGQLHETWRNLEQLCNRAGMARPRYLRVYVRHAADYPRVARFVAERLPPKVPVAYLLADICRSELLVEIEGIYRIVPVAD
jgi:chorismate lyase/3-hydroxybenzoate synthase